MRPVRPERLVVAPSQEEMAGAVAILNRTVIRPGVVIGLGSLRGAHLHRMSQRDKRLVLVLAEGHPWAGLDEDPSLADPVIERLADRLAERLQAEFYLAFEREGEKTCLTLTELSGRGTWVTTLAAHLIARGAAAARAATDPALARAARTGSLAEALGQRR